MPRQPRYFVPGVCQHVIQRGVNRQAVFFRSADRVLYLRALEEAAERFECAIHAYVLMTNHTHLLLTPASARSLPLLMQAMGRNYVQRLNKLHNRTGTLWEGRYRASPVQDDVYLLTCYRYIELNPVRAGLVSTPADYPYSSFGHNALGKRDPVVTPHDNYTALGCSPKSRRRAYVKLFADVIAGDLLRSIRETTNACLVLGNDRFKDKLEAVLGRSVRPGKRGRPSGVGR